MRKTVPAKRPGFTILEMTLVIGILVVLVTLTMVLSVNAIGRSALTSGESVIVQTIRRAHTLGQNTVENSSWGVCLCPGPVVPTECEAAPPDADAHPSVILFKRSAFLSYNAASDQAFELHPDMSFTGALFLRMTTTGKPGLVFNQVSGTPTTSGAIIFSLNGESRTLTVNGKGLVEH